MKWGRGYRHIPAQAWLGRPGRIQSGREMGGHDPRLACRFTSGLPPAISIRPDRSRQPGGGQARPGPRPRPMTQGADQPGRLHRTMPRQTKSQTAACMLGLSVVWFFCLLLAFPCQPRRCNIRDGIVTEVTIRGNFNLGVVLEKPNPQITPSLPLRFKVANHTVGKYDDNNSSVKNLTMHEPSEELPVLLCRPCVCVCIRTYMSPRASQERGNDRRSFRPARPPPSGSTSNAHQV